MRLRHLKKGAQIMILDVRRMRAARENIAPNPLVQGLKHLASTDGASAWWFAKVDTASRDS